MVLLVLCIFLALISAQSDLPLPRFESRVADVPGGVQQKIFRKIRRVFKTYAKSSSDGMDASELKAFFSEHQKQILTDEQVVSFFGLFSKSNKDKLSLAEFQSILLDDNRNGAFDPSKLVLYQRMSEPLNRYFISSSHNTYLESDQLVGPSSTRAYRDVLLTGCRCIEIDIWDGNGGGGVVVSREMASEPIVFHGNTLTSKILFKDVLEAVKENAFKASTYPLILSFENHCSASYQEKMARHLEQVFGDLLLRPTDDTPKQLPSPEDLKGKILIKGKRGGGTVEALSKLTYLEAISFKDFAATSAYKPNQMSSFSESKISKISQDPEQASQFKEYNSKFLSRVYPRGDRFGSSNYLPIAAWSMGSHMVALNYQTRNTPPMWLNYARFIENGNTGYVLKATSEKAEQKIRIRIHGARNLPGMDFLDDSGDRVLRKKRKHVKISVYDPSFGVETAKFSGSKSPGGDARFHASFSSSITDPNNAFLLVSFWYKKRDKSKGFLGFFGAPVSCLRQGTRQISLVGGDFQPISATALVTISLEANEANETS